MPSHDCCWGGNSHSCEGHNWLRKNHKISHPGHMQGTQKDTVPAAVFNRHSSTRSADHMVSPTWGNCAAQQCCETSGKWHQTHQVQSCFRDTWEMWLSAKKLDKHYETFSMSVVSNFKTSSFWPRLGFFFIHFPWTFKQWRFTHTWTLTESEFKACMLEYSQIDN